MNPIYTQILIMLSGMAAQGLFTIWFFRWRKQVERPEKELQEIKDVLSEHGDDIRKAREALIRIRTILNGKGWSINWED